MSDLSATQAPTTSKYPARSKMLDTYLSDIALMLRDANWNAAEAAALALPHLAVSLTDPQFMSSREHYKAWCSRWVRPTLGDTVYETWCTQASACQAESSRAVPFAALRALRLRRLERGASRQALSPFSIEHDDPRATEVTAACLSLLAATLRWYTQSARDDGVVQHNLGRLGVLS